MSFKRYLTRCAVVHWPRACAAQLTGHVSLTCYALGFERAGNRVGKVASFLWNGLPM